MRRWLDGVTSKLEEVIAPSSSNPTANDCVCSVPAGSNSRNEKRYVSHPSQSLNSSTIDSRLNEHLLELAQLVLSERQKFLLLSASEELRYDSMTLTKLCERLARELRMCYSTVKWNLKRLRVLKLLLGGTEESKGARAQLTPLGYLIVSMLTKNESASPNDTIIGKRY